MTVQIAVGVGCRRGCSAAAIDTLVRQALAQLASGPQPLGLFTIGDKCGEAGLVEAASRLGLDLVYLPRDALLAQASSVRTPSDWAQRLFGVPSVAEAAALAGAGPDATLIVARMASQGATCAIAGSGRFRS